MSTQVRWCDPDTRGWISRDPGGFAMGDANLYRAMGNALTDWVDPGGTEYEPLIQTPTVFGSQLAGYYVQNFTIVALVNGVYSWGEHYFYTLPKLLFQGNFSGAASSHLGYVWGLGTYLGSPFLQFASDTWVKPNVGPIMNHGIGQGQTSGPFAMVLLSVGPLAATPRAPAAPARVPPKVQVGFYYGKNPPPSLPGTGLPKPPPPPATTFTPQPPTSPPPPNPPPPPTTTWGFWWPIVKHFPPFRGPG